jgi:predicted RNA-binding protein with RPS1 domain
MTGPTIDDKGQVSLQSVEQLPRNVLREWIFDRLHGHDAWIPLDARDAQMPHYLFRIIYPKLDFRTREKIEEVIFEFLSSLARDVNSEWLGEPGEEMLLLADPVFSRASRREDVIDMLISIAESERFQRSHGLNLGFRALQALTMLEHRASPDFWHRQFQRGNDSFAPVVLEGLGLIDSSQVFAWLATITWNKALHDALEDYLPSLLEDYGSYVVVPQIRGLLPRLSKKALTEFTTLCHSLGIEILPLNQPPLNDQGINTAAIYRSQIPAHKVRNLVGRGGQEIRRITQQTGANIDVDNSGIVRVVSNDPSVAERAFQMINSLVEEFEPGKTYLGKVTHMFGFGAYVELIPGTEGLLPITEIGEHNVRNIRDELKEGDRILVQIVEIEGTHIGLSRKAALKNQRNRVAASKGRHWNTSAQRWPDLGLGSKKS